MASPLHPSSTTQPGSSASEMTLDPELRAQAIAGINVKLGVSVLCGFGSYAFWPSSIEWWGFATHSVCLGGMSVALLVGAVRSMATLRRIDQTLAAYQDLGAGPKGAQLADDNALIAAGMVDAPHPENGSAKPSMIARLGKLWGRAS